MKRRAAALAGSVVGGVLASACCLVPLAFVLLGISGAAFAQRFEPNPRRAQRARQRRVRRNSRNVSSNW